YLFPPSGKREVWWVHTHEQEYRARVLDRLQQELPAAESERLEEEFESWLEGHWLRYHRDEERRFVPVYDAGAPSMFGEVGFASEHMHVIKATLRAEQLAKRIDINPLVWHHDGFAHADRVFF